MFRKETRTSKIGVLRFAAAFSAVMMSVCSVFAEEDPYAGYVKLNTADWASTASWNVVGGWSDKQAPHSDANYYVPAGKRLWRTSTNQEDDQFSTWQGGQLVIAGTLHVDTSQGDRYSPQISDLVLLGGSDVRTATYGPFYPRNNVTSVVTVAGTISNPAKISHHYQQSYTSGGGVRSHALYAFFRGDAESALLYTRQFRNYNGLACDHGFFVYAPNFIFSEYPGTVIINGGNTIFKPDASSTFNWPLTALKVEDEANCYFYNGSSFTEKTANAYLRSLDFSGGKILLNCKSEDETFKAFPVINVSEKFQADANSTIMINGLNSSMIKGITPTDDTGHVMKIAHLPSQKDEDSYDLSKLKISSLTENDYGKFFTLLNVDNDDGSRDVYLATPGIVTMTNANVESSGYPAGSVQYSAFQQGYAGDWSNLETPTPDSKLHYWAVKRLCFFESVKMPDATLTMDVNCSWKSGADLHFKEINIFTGKSFGLWGGNSVRTLKADKLNILRADTDANKYVSLYIGQIFTVNIDAEIVGEGALALQNNNDLRCTFILPHLSTNFNGKLIVSQAMNTKKLTKYQLQCKVSDARNLGGEYTVSEDKFDAIEFRLYPSMLFVNDVSFTDPTRGMYINAGVQFDVASGKTLKLANQVTYAGVLMKTGAGMLDLAGTCRFIDGKPETAPVASSNELHMTAGDLKISSKLAADGLSVKFEEGTKLVIPADSEAGYYNVKCSDPLIVNTNDGKLPVQVEFPADAVVGNVEVPICTFSAEAAAKIPVSLFTLVRPSNGCAVKSFEKKTLEDGNISYVATVGTVGTQIIVR